MLVTQTRLVSLNCAAVQRRGTGDRQTNHRPHTSGTTDAISSATFSVSPPAPAKVADGVIVWTGHIRSPRLSMLNNLLL